MKVALLKFFVFDSQKFYLVLQLFDLTFQTCDRYVCRAKLLTEFTVLFEKLFLSECHRGL
jgi:hypothetical protein